MENDNKREKWFICYNYDGRFFQTVITIPAEKSPWIDYYKFDNAFRDWLKNHSRTVPYHYVDYACVINFVRVGNGN